MRHDFFSDTQRNHLTWAGCISLFVQLACIRPTESGVRITAVCCGNAEWRLVVFRYSYSHFLRSQMVCQTSSVELTFGLIEHLD
jgi:hypothetical protein